MQTYINFIQKGLLSAIFFSLPLYPKLTSISIALLFVLSFSTPSREPIRNLKIIYFLFPLFFLFYLLGGVFSENIDFWSRDLETKLSFIIIPVVFWNLKNSIIKTKDLFFLFFILGVVISSLFCYLQGLECWDEEQARFCFESSSLAFNFHPSYLSMYYMIAIIIAWHQYFFSSYKIVWLILAIIVSLILPYFIYKFYAVGPWVSMICTVFLLFFHYFYKKRELLKFVLSISFVSIALSIGVSKLELFESDFNVIKKELVDYSNSPKQYYENNKGNTSSTKARLIIWGITLDLVNEYKWGVGGGDIKDVLINRYEELGLDEYVKSKLNPHNQYLQTALALGLVIGFYLLFMVVAFLVYGFKTNNVLLITIASMLLTSMLFESILEKQEGVVFFTVMIYFIFLVSEPNTLSKKNLTE